MFWHLQGASKRPVAAHCGTKIWTTNKTGFCTVRQKNHYENNE